MTVSLNIKAKYWPGGKDFEVQSRNLTFPAGRPCLVVPVQAQITLSLGNVPLPEIARWVDSEGKPWKSIELPSANMEDKDNKGLIQQELQLEIHIPGNATETFSIILDHQIPRPPSGVREEESEHSTIETSTVELIVDSHVGTFQEIQTRSVTNTVWCSEEPYEDLSISILPTSSLDHNVFALPLKHSLSLWRSLSEDKKPAKSIIVKIAENLQPVLEDLCLRPRKILTRRREPQPIRRAQEMDVTCLRWLIRQPGRNLIQKAGAKQQVLAVTRFENIDTLENRVLKDFLCRCGIACRRYISEYHHYRDHQYIKLVKQLQILIKRFLIYSPISCAGNISGPLIPNFALMFDSRYRQIWKYYVLLLRQQRLEEQIWQWRNRIWAEMCEMMVLSSLNNVCGGNNTLSPALRSDLWLHPDPERGKFVDPSSFLDQWLILDSKKPLGVWFIKGSAWPDVAKSLNIKSGAFDSLCPDAVIVLRPELGSLTRHIVGIWTLCEFDVQGSSLSQRLNELNNSLSDLNDEYIRGLLFRPVTNNNTENKEFIIWNEKYCMGIEFAQPPGFHLKKLDVILEKLLNISEFMPVIELKSSHLQKIL